ncbi:actin-like ATPase domain-containing protein [Martensiomyces pterosporus]|nr:actin-like ATPase domain-containing protein [Martensiomyces pterosporus]
MASSFTSSVSALSSNQLKFLAQVSTAFAVSDEQLSTIISQLSTELALGLKHGHKSDLYMNPSFVHTHSTPNSTALSMAIESSGRRIRISSVTFGADASVARSETQVFVTPAANTKSVPRFFDFVAYCIREFIHTHDLERAALEEHLPLGFTLGFPVSDCSTTSSATQKRIECHVSELTKEDSLDLGGSDVARKLCDAIRCNRLPVRVTSVTNNVVSALIAAQHKDKATRVAASFNHGVNAAYYEKLNNVEKINPARNAQDTDEVAINTELGRFGSSTGSLPLNMWDRRIDRESRNPGRQAFEKLVADQYLGEIVRNLLTDFMDSHLLFTVNCPAEKISSNYSFYTAYMGSIMEDESQDLAAVSAIFAAEFGIATTLGDRQIIRALCEIVAARASRLSGAALAALVLKSNTSASSALVTLSGALQRLSTSVAILISSGLLSMPCLFKNMPSPLFMFIVVTFSI